MNRIVISNEEKINSNYLVASTFPGGEEYVKIKSIPRSGGLVVISLEDASSRGIMRLVMVHNALLNLAVAQSEIALDLCYVPYARQDRVCATGEANSIVAFANVINSLNFKFVIAVDTHSFVAGAVIKNLTVIDQLDCFKTTLQSEGFIGSTAGLVVIAPDYGAEKKAEKIAKYLNVPIEVCRKMRNGKDIGIVVPDLSAYTQAIVVDDICDAGGTFISLANAIKAQQPKDKPLSLKLYVTHAILKNKENLTELLQHYQDIYTYNMLGQSAGCRSIRKDGTGKIGSENSLKGLLRDIANVTSVGRF